MCSLLKRPNLSHGARLKHVWLGTSGIEELEVGEANANLSSLDFESCSHLTRVKLTGLISLGPLLIIKQCKLLKEVELIGLEKLERLAVKSCTELEVVRVIEASPIFRSVQFSHLHLNSRALQDFLDGAPTVTELFISNFSKMKSIKLVLPDEHKLKTLSASKNAGLRKVRVAGSTIESITLQGNLELRHVKLDCENLQRLQPSDLLWLALEDESYSVTKPEKKSLETIRVRSNKISTLRIADSSSSLRDVEVDCAGLKQIALRNVDVDRLDEGSGNAAKMLWGDNLEAAILDDVVLPPKQAFSGAGLHVISCSMTTSNNTKKEKVSNVDQPSPKRQRYSLVAHSTPKEIEIGSQKLQLLFLTDLAYLRRLTFLADRLPTLQWVDLTGCLELEDEAIIELADRCYSLRKLILNGCIALTDRVGPALSNLKETLKILDLSETRLKNVELHLDELEHLDLSECTRLRDCMLDCGKLQGLVVNGVSGDVRSMLGKLRSSKLRFVWLRRARQRSASREGRDRNDKKKDKGKQLDDEVAFKVADLAGLSEKLELLDMTESKLSRDVIEGLVGSARTLSLLLAARSR
jgi:hypothetical protein